MQRRGQGDTRVHYAGEHITYTDIGEVRGPAEAYKYVETRKRRKVKERKVSRNSATGTVAFSRGGRPRGGPSHNPRVGPHQRPGESPTRARRESDGTEKRR